MSSVGTGVNQTAKDIMISISFRSALLYNFGIAIIFVLVGLLSVYTLEVTRPNRDNELPAFTREARLTIEQEQEIETIRGRALFYFDIARGTRRARLQDESHVYNDVRVLAFMVAGMFVVSGILVLLLPRERHSH
jgi:hypothetical protein